MLSIVILTTRCQLSSAEALLTQAVGCLCSCMCLQCLSCVLQHSPDLRLDNVAFPALKEDKLLSASKFPTVIRGSRVCLEVHLIRAQIILPYFQHTDQSNGH